MSLLQNNNLSPLPFYTKENEAKPWFAYGDYQPILSPVGKVPLFQIQLPSGTTIPSTISANVYSKDGTLEYSSVTIGSCGSVTIGNYKYLWHNLNHIDTTHFPKGVHYITIVLGGTTYYSGLFCNTNIPSCLQLSWKDNQNLTFDAGAIYYDSTNYPNNLYYLCTELGSPTYEFEEEVEERDGYQFPIKQISYKKYRFSFLATEAMCDALRIARLSDVVSVTFNGKTYHCTSILLTPTWQEQGYLASVECEFTTDTVVKKIGQAY